jgi:hypothetical protein
MLGRLLHRGLAFYPASRLSSRSPRGIAARSAVAARSAAAAQCSSGPKFCVYPAPRHRAADAQGPDWTTYFRQQLCTALRIIPVREAILDGEVVVEGAGGMPNLRSLMHNKLEIRAAGGRRDHYFRDAR